MNGEPWGVLQVVANHEKKVAQHLTARSLEHYLPLYVERSRWTDRTVTLNRPLFPGYLFVRYSPQERLAVITTPGVFKLLGDGMRGTVDEAEINRIRQGLSSGCVLRPHPGITVGMRVRVRRGIFADAEGYVTELRGNCNVVLSLAAVERFFSLQVDRSDLEIIGKTGVGVPVPPGARQANARLQNRKILAG